MIITSRPLRITLIIALSTVGVAALLALIFLIAGQWLPEAGAAKIQWGSHSTTLHGALTSGVLEFLLAWAVITMAILFAAAITLFVLSVTAFALGFSAVVVSLPLIVVGLVLWWVIRRSNRAAVGVVAGPTTQA